jgi:osmoprotectant transport system permease protein
VFLALIFDAALYLVGRRLTPWTRQGSSSTRKARA